jgi:hypothetical protein
MTDARMAGYIATLRKRLADPRLRMLGVDAELRAIADALECLAARSPPAVHPLTCECEPCALNRMITWSPTT